MSFDYKNVLPPVGEAQNFIVKEMFDDIKEYVGDLDSLYLPLAGGTMSGNIAMGGNKVTGLAAATNNGDAVRFEQLVSLKVLQVVTATFTGSFSTTSTSFASSNLTASITPTSASNRILIIAHGGLEVASTTLGATVKWTIDRSSTNLGDATEGFGTLANYISSATSTTSVPFTTHHLDSPATTSATTYTIQLKVSGAGVTAYLPRNAGTRTTITLMEVV